MVEAAPISNGRSSLVGQSLQADLERISSPSGQSSSTIGSRRVLAPIPATTPPLARVAAQSKMPEKAPTADRSAGKRADRFADDQPGSRMSARAEGQPTLTQHAIVAVNAIAFDATPAQLELPKLPMYAITGANAASDTVSSNPTDDSSSGIANAHGPAPVGLRSAANAPGAHLHTISASPTQRPLDETEDLRADATPEIYVDSSATVPVRLAPTSIPEPAQPIGAMHLTTPMVEPRPAAVLGDAGVNGERQVSNSFKDSRTRLAPTSNRSVTAIESAATAAGVETRSAAPRFGSSIPPSGPAHSAVGLQTGGALERDPGQATAAPVPIAEGSAATTQTAPSAAHDMAAHDMFAELDARPPGSAPTWLHAGAQHVEAGFEDPALGWVSVRAELGGGGVRAALVPGSDHAAAALNTHLAGLNAFLAERHAGVGAVTVAAPETRSPEWGQGMVGDEARQAAGQGSHGASDSPNSNGNQGQGLGAGEVSRVSESLGALDSARRDRGDDLHSGRLEPALIASSYAGTRISVMA